MTIVVSFKSLSTGSGEFSNPEYSDKSSTYLAEFLSSAIKIVFTKSS